MLCFFLDQNLDLCSFNLMERRGQDKELEMPTTLLGYNSSSSSKLSSSSTTIGVEKSDQPFQTHSTTTTLIFNDPPPQSHQPHRHHHPLYPPPHLLVPSNNQLHQPQRTSTDPDLISNHPSPIATTSTISAPIASNSPRTPPITIAATTTQTPATTTTNITSTTTSSTSLIRYRECLRNHAASMGSHVVDGCGEFMPGGEEGTPESLKCAACDCHRNFHRKEVEGSSLQQQEQHQQQQHASSNYQSYYPNKHNGQNNSPSPHLQFYTPPSSSLYQQQHHRFSHGVAAATTPSGGLVQPVMMAFGGVAESSSEDLNMFHSNTVGGQLSVQATMSKKRFRTKFTQNQKDRMMELAEKLGWKIQKHDEQEVQQFCTQVGVKRQIFKVWMHNNKQVMKKKQHM